MRMYCVYLPLRFASVKYVSEMNFSIRSNVARQCFCTDTFSILHGQPSPFSTEKEKVVHCSNQTYTKNVHTCMHSAYLVRVRILEEWKTAVATCVSKAIDRHVSVLRDWWYWHGELLWELRWGAEACGGSRNGRCLGNEVSSRYVTTRKQLIFGRVLGWVRTLSCITRQDYGCESPTFSLSPLTYMPVLE